MAPGASLAPPMNSWTYRPPLLLNPAAIVRTPVTGSSCMVRRCGRGLPLLSVTRGRRIRNLSWNEIGQSTCRDNRKHRDTCHDEEAKLQCTQARIRVDAHRLLHLLGRSGGGFHHAPQPVVADEVDAIEVELRLDLRRQFRIFGDACAEWRRSADRQGAHRRQRCRRRPPDCWWCRAASRRRRQALWARR